MPMLLLEILRRSDRLGPLSVHYISALDKYRRTVELAAKVSHLLDSAGIPHAIIKSIRPYVSPSEDIDVLIFSDTDYTQAVHLIGNEFKKSHPLMRIGPESIHFRNHDVMIDLYREVAASRFVYLAKERLRPFVYRKELPNGLAASILKPEADLTLLLAHSVIKEQMYTLSEFYSTLFYLVAMDKRQMEAFQDIVGRSGLKRAAAAHMVLSLFLHKSAFGIVPDRLVSVVHSLPGNSFEKRRLAVNQFWTPHKFHPLTVLEALLEELAKERVARRSIVAQAISHTSFRFSAKVLSQLVSYLRRETY